MRALKDPVGALCVPRVCLACCCISLCAAVGRCPELSLIAPDQYQKAQELDCAGYVRDTLGLHNMFVSSRQSSMPLCTDLKEAAPTLSIRRVYN